MILVYIIYVCLHIYLTPLPQAGCDTRWISKRSAVGFSVSLSHSFTKAKEPRRVGEIDLLQQFSYSWGENRWIHIFPNDISAKWSANCLIQDLDLFADSISNHDNHYTKSASRLYIYIYIWVCVCVTNINDNTI